VTKIGRKHHFELNREEYLLIGTRANKEADSDSELHAIFLGTDLTFPLVGDCLDGMLYISSLGDGSV
jgi:hypothetical protein